MPPDIANWVITVESGVQGFLFLGAGVVLCLNGQNLETLDVSGDANAATLDGGLWMEGLPNLQSVNLGTCANLQYISLQNCPNLSSISDLTGFQFSQWGGLGLNGCAFNASAVDAIFNQLAVEIPPGSPPYQQVDLSGGTNAAPTDASASARAALAAAGILITTN